MPDRPFGERTAFAHATNGCIGVSQFQDGPTTALLAAMKLRLLFSACLLTLIAAPAQARDQARSRIEAPAPEVKVVTGSTGKAEPFLRVTITAAEREIIQQYVGSHSGSGKKAKTLPPGLAKKAAAGSLPPGWQKKLAAGELMPPEVFQQCQPLPRELAAKLPTLPKGVVTVVIEGKVVRLVEATREILDVFDLLPK